VTTHDLRDAEVKQAMIRSAARVILAADSTKFRQTAMAVVTSATAVDMIVTDVEAPAEIVESLRAAGVEVRCV
jgi:DeoR/GlpR family transcriptional regulator of sugar metabolism